MKMQHCFGCRRVSSSEKSKQTVTLWRILLPYWDHDSEGSDSNIWRGTPAHDDAPSHRLTSGQKVWRTDRQTVYVHMLIRGASSSTHQMRQKVWRIDRQYTYTCWSEGRLHPHIKGVVETVIHGSRMTTGLNLNTSKPDTQSVMGMILNKSTRTWYATRFVTWGGIHRALYPRGNLPTGGSLLTYPKVALFSYSVKPELLPRLFYPEVNLS